MATLQDRVDSLERRLQNLDLQHTITRDRVRYVEVDVNSLKMMTGALILDVETLKSRDMSHDQQIAALEGIVEVLKWQDVVEQTKAGE